jgi:tetratricopeptide (TPR) repeat protein
MRETARRALLCLSLVAIAGGHAAAERAGQKEARELYRKGLTQHELGDYEGAIVAFKRAYELTRAPGLLFNIAQSARLKKDYQQARELYRSYLRQLPDARNRADVETLIGQMERILTEQQQAAPAPAAPVEPPPVAAPSPVTPPQVSIPPSAADRPPPDRNRGRTLKWTGIVMAAAGAAALIAGIGTGVHALERSSELEQLREQRAPWDEGAQAAYDDGNRSAAASTALYVVGGVLAATGTVLAIVGARKHSAAMRAAARPRLAFAPLPGGLALGAGCDF